MASALLSQIINLLGTIVLLKSLYDFASFISLHFGASTVHKYIYGRAPYALVTGATDGIGKAVAKELYKRGFNLILHGRNPEKLNKVKEELQRLGTRDVRVWVEDASRAQIDFEKAVQQWDDLEITLVVHNVGGAPPRADTIDGVAEEDLLVDVRKNALFPFLLARAVLPKLRKATGPARMVFIGSYAGEGNLPRLTPYGPTKAFLKRMSGCLGADERAWNPTRVSTLYVTVGSVVSNSHRVAESLFTPSAESYAKPLVDKLGCGGNVLVPWLLHAIQFWFVSFIPEVFLDKIMQDEMLQELEAAKKLGQ